MEQYWLVWSNEHKAWWGPDGIGYTKIRKDAGRYTRNEAIEICKRANCALSDNQEPQETMLQDV
jgi:hypothetical protein